MRMLQRSLSEDQRRDTMRPLNKAASKSRDGTSTGIGSKGFFTRSEAIRSTDALWGPARSPAIP